VVEITTTQAKKRGINSISSEFMAASLHRDGGKGPEKKCRVGFVRKGVDGVPVFTRRYHVSCSSFIIRFAIELLNTDGKLPE
jgi:hypothetical protein